MEKTVRLINQYLKDLSFENPKFPHKPKLDKVPNINVQINVEARKIELDHYEVVIQGAIEAKIKNGEEESKYFHIELYYGGLFLIKNIAEEELEPLLLIYCPNILFPYFRRIVSDITRDGGLNPLMLEPIDFALLYQSKKQLLQRKSQEIHDTNQQLN
ncbi:MAG: protein-export chaperone SecB [Alphaproteobacteria bacterium]|jgi:preprotein translocase subunit SecB